MDKKVRHYLLLDRVVIQNANAISSPITYGFPAINGFVGAIHALSRKIPESINVTLGGVLIAVHEVNPQIYRKNQFSDYTFNQTRNPILRSGRTGAIIEEGRVHLVVSLVVEIKTASRALSEKEEQIALIKLIENNLMAQSMAGGSIINIDDITIFSKTERSDLVNHLLPAFVLMDASNDLKALLEEEKSKGTGKSELDLLIDTAKIYQEPIKNEEDSKVEWESRSIKKGRGWLVPITVGYQGIFPKFSAGSLENARSNHHESQYVEPIYTLGKWVFPFRLRGNIDSAFWHYAEVVNECYRLIQSPLTEN